MLLLWMEGMGWSAPRDNEPAHSNARELLPLGLGAKIAQRREID
jgi:hypothetical protein